MDRIFGCITTQVTGFRRCLRAGEEGVQRRCVKTDLDSLATALYVKADDLLKD